MKNVLLTISLIANVVLAGGLFYTVTEMNNIDNQRESLAISNEQYKRKLEESSSTSKNDKEFLESATSDSSSSVANAQITSESSTEEVKDTHNSVTSTVQIGTHTFLFPIEGVTIEQDPNRQGSMSELSHEFPVTVTNTSGTFNATLVQDNNDNNCFIIDENGNNLYTGTYQ